MAACVAPAVQAQTPVKVEYYHLDALGSVRMTSGAPRQPTREFDCAPFGEVVAGRRAITAGTDLRLMTCGLP